MISDIEFNSFSHQTLGGLTFARSRFGALANSPARDRAASAGAGEHSHRTSALPAFVFRRAGLLDRQVEQLTHYHE